MARSCGIRVGSRRFEIVVLEGNAKKHRITAFKAGEFPVGGEDPLASQAQALREAAKELDIPLDSTAIAVDTGLAAFRTVKLPISDREKLEEIIKFEVESLLPQWDIQDVVVDFLVQDQVDNETSLLVTAVPKSDLQQVVGLCERAGVEPLEAELEATAMVSAALGADICHVDDAQVLVHVGEATTSVVVLDGGKVRSMRALHMGALSEQTSAEPAAPAAEGEAPAAPAEPAVASAPLPEDPDTMQRRLSNAAARIRRELGRALSGARTVNPIDAIYVSGIELPDLIGSQIQDVPVYVLDVFEEDGGQPASGASLLVVPYGVALRQLGGPSVGASLRREELRFTGAFERIELPVAVAALLLATLAGMFCMFEFLKLRGRRQDVTAWRQSTNNFLVGDPARGVPGYLAQPLDDLTKYLSKSKTPDGDPERNEYEQMQYVHTLLAREVKSLEKKLGTDGEITQPQSALEALTLVLGVFDQMKDQVGRFSLRVLDAQYQPGVGQRPDSVRVQLNLSVFADSALTATRGLEKLVNEMRTKPWVTDVDPKGSKEFEDQSHGAGIYVEGFTVTCDLSKVLKAGQP